MFFEPRNVTEFYFAAPEQDRTTNQNETEFKFRKRRYILQHFFFSLKSKVNKYLRSRYLACPCP
jgi:hypothetical protein